MEDPFWTLNSDLSEVREEAMKIYGEIGIQRVRGAGASILRQE